MIIIFPTPAQALLQTPVNCFSPSSTPLANIYNGATYYYIPTLGVWATTPGSVSTGTVYSVDVSGGTTGLTYTGGPITTGGTITMAGTLALTNGGTGATTQAGAQANLLPTQTGNAGKVLSTDGAGVISWITPGGAGTVTSVGITGTNGIGVVSGSPVTTSGSITLAIDIATLPVLP